MLALLLAAQLAVTATTPVTAPTAPDSTLKSRVEIATREFLLYWHDAWRETQGERRPKSANDLEWQLHGDLTRTYALHCHTPPVRESVRRRIIVGPSGSQPRCPGWYPADGPAIEDERRVLDGALSPARRLWIRQLRSTLRVLLDSAAHTWPSDVFITRQRVRFALDADDLLGAVSAAATCGPDLVQCGLLQGLVLHRAGVVGAADSTFLAAAAKMPASERCAWTDISALLDIAVRRRYEGMSCAERAAVDASFWWLSDPLFLEAGNERRAEHFSRKVALLLIAPPMEDRRFHLRPEMGGEAVAEAFVRYGWPTQVYWGGVQVDFGHNEWLRVNHLVRAPPYVLPEYSRDRLHTAPRSAVLDNPFVASPDDWQLDGLHDDVEWWPVEHFARDQSRIVQLPIGQCVMLRRSAATRFVWGADLDARLLGRAAGDSIRAELFHSRELGEVRSVGSFRGAVGRPLIVDAPLDAGPALLGIELGGDTMRTAARTRFGVKVLEPLSAFAGGRAVSQPLLFDPAKEIRGPMHADSAIARMYGSTTLDGIRRIGLYWEVYGFDRADTLDIAVRINREDRPGILRQIAGVLRLSPDHRGAVGLTWQETRDNSAAVHLTEGSVPVQLRSIVLDAAQLAPGKYSVSVSVTGSRRTAVSAEREFVLR